MGDVLPPKPKRQGRSKRKYETAPFIAWDGEGYNAPNSSAANLAEEHRYYLMAFSDGKRPTFKQDIKGLSTVAALDFLQRGFDAHPGAIHVIFSGNYDVNMILRDLTPRQLVRLWLRKRVAIEDYRIEYVPRKWFRVDLIDAEALAAGEFKWKARNVLWDVVGFFQSSFLDALVKYFGPDYHRLALIEWGKGARQAFTKEDFQRARKYCGHECAGLVELMDRLRFNLKATQLSVSRWDGAGAVASSLLRREGIKQHQDQTFHSENLERGEIMWRGYFGGRIEQVGFGKFTGVVHSYDINSAYPFAATQLPTFSEGQWIHHVSGTERLTDRFAIVHVKWRFDEGPNLLYPFPYRTRAGTILFPNEGEGWYWLPEVMAARSALAMGYLSGSLSELEAWEWQTRLTQRPFDFIPALYEARRAMKEAGEGSEKAVKLGLNSLYGKLAQQVGGRDGKPPSSQQLEWAGYITSVTRASLFSAMLTNPGGVIQLTTDGIYSSEPLDVSTGKDIGEWEYKRYAGMISIQSGVYALLDEDGAIVNEWYRGYGRSIIPFERIVKEWAKHTGEAPFGLALDISVTRFVTLGSALMGGDLWRNWRRWRTASRALNLLPTQKRVPFDMQWTKRRNPSKRLMATIAREADEYLGYGEISAPYKHQKYAEQWDGVHVDQADKEVEDASY